MKTIVFASAAVICLGIGAAWADQGGEDSGLVNPNSYFTELPGVDPVAPGVRANDAVANPWQTGGQQPTASLQASPYGGMAATTSRGS